MFLKCFRLLVFVRTSEDDYAYICCSGLERWEDGTRNVFWLVLCSNLFVVKFYISDV